MEVEVWFILIMILTSCNLVCDRDVSKGPVSKRLQCVLVYKNTVQRDWHVERDYNTERVDGHFVKQLKKTLMACLMVYFIT